MARARPYGNCSPAWYVACSDVRAPSSGCVAGTSRALLTPLKTLCSDSAFPLPLGSEPSATSSRSSENFEPRPERKVIGAETRGQSCAHSRFYFIVDPVAAPLSGSRSQEREDLRTWLRYMEATRATTTATTLLKYSKRCLHHGLPSFLSCSPCLLLALPQGLGRRGWFPAILPAPTHH